MDFFNFFKNLDFDFVHCYAVTVTNVYLRLNKSKLTFFITCSKLPIIVGLIVKKTITLKIVFYQKKLYYEKSFIINHNDNIIIKYNRVVDCSMYYKSQLGEESALLVN